MAIGNTQARCAQAQNGTAAGNPEMMAQGGSYTIAEAARLLDVAPSTLRYWEAEGLIESTRRPGSNYRTYSIRSLFAASYVAFFRSMDVPVKTIVKNQSDTLEELITMLDETQHEVDQRLERLRLISKRLRRQRLLAQSAFNLIGQGVREATPAAIRLEAYAPQSVRQREMLLRDSQRYGVFIDAKDPHTMHEGCMEFPGSDPACEEGESVEVLWDRSVELARHIRFFEGVAFSEKGGEVRVEMDELFDDARRAGQRPLYALAHFLVTANFGGIKDCYRVWVACA